MEGMFVWIVLFAGGALLFLGVLLIASERELKNKRREVEALLSKLEGFSEGTSSTGGASLDSNPSAEVTELRAHNRELENKISGLVGELERSRRAIQDMQATHETSTDNSTETQEKLYESATRIRQLEDRALRHQEERQNLAAHITELEKKLSATEQSERSANNRNCASRSGSANMNWFSGNRELPKLNNIANGSLLCRHPIMLSFRSRRRCQKSTVSCKPISRRSRS